MRSTPRKLLAALSLGAVLISSCAATLTLRANPPAFDNGGTCTAPQLTPRSGGTMMHFAWAGPVAGEDSIFTTTFAAVLFTRTVPSGVYQCRAWASDSGGVSCDTTATFRFDDKPGKPTGFSR